MNFYVVLTFYQFTELLDCEAMKIALLKLMQENGIKGTIILAKEGLNGTFCGTSEAVVVMMNHLRSYPGFADLQFKQSYNPINPFNKAKVKLRKEIVTMGQTGLDPRNCAGTHVSPDAWNALIADPNVLLIDTRNDYEVQLGAFKGAINPCTENFRDFPEYVQSHLIDQKDKKIAMYCTGGIRCEKSTAYLKKLGFEQVYQLEGGILNYLASISKEESMWEGDCFVFDDRVALNKQLQSLQPGSIDPEWKNNNRKKTKDYEQCIDNG